MSALIPALIGLAMRGRGGGGGGGGGRGRSGGGRGGSGEPRGKKPFDAQGWLDTEAGKDQLDDPFDMTPDRSSQQHWDSIFRLYNNATPIPEPSIPDPSRRGFGRAEE